MKTLAYGFPKLGEKREFKAILEGFFSGNLPIEELLQSMKNLEGWRLATLSQHVDLYSAGELSLYDPVLDLAYSLGLIPERFLPERGLNTYFEMARGKSALEMTKWFNTNYHYIVPELLDTNFTPRLTLCQHYWEWARGKTTSFSLVGPYTFLRLSKQVRFQQGSGWKSHPLTPSERLSLLEPLADAYAWLLFGLKQMGVEQFFLHEPALCTDLLPEEWQELKKAYAVLARKASELYLLTYYDSVAELRSLLEFPVRGIGLDFLSNQENLEGILEWGFPEEKVLIAGVVSGRSVFRTPLKETLERIRTLLQKLSPRELWLSNAQPLYHLPITVAKEEKLPGALKGNLAFARERLEELALLKGVLTQAVEEGKILAAERERRASFTTEDPAVRRELNSLTPSSFERALPYRERIELQHEILKLPLLPTTTIGSFPQTPELRRLRNAYRNGELSEEQYQKSIEEEIRKLIRYQEELGLDVLVHGEFERTDMVEFFAEKLRGMAVTQHGWVLSYGSRVYRPPIIYGDVSRPYPMTVREITFAQSLTAKPVKGMLTGPVTILNWSYAREDLPRSEIAFMIALAIQKEVEDLEKAGIKIIQIDEPAYREGAPLKKRNWQEYFSWAARAFRLASRAKPETQIHTHMCYSEFGEILGEIFAMDFDVISIEASRSKGELVDAFATHPGWDRELGIGVYDIHSPAIPPASEIEEILRRALEVLPKELLWVNPDCGLKTRRWEEVTPALKNMVRAARNLRELLATLKT